ncbi:MAG TPA: tetratricopeptide repeat protein [Gemmatimonadaceae bacterium]|nr:tetratricopeptide repeat protein [Gemmatimonadaceae bacterium]
MQRLKLFGGLSIESESGPLRGRAVQRRRLALLALLAVARAREGGLSRDRLVALLWPEADAENGRRFLSDSVYRINQALGGDVILAAGDELRLESRRLPSDVGQFEDALSRADHEAAVRMYVGPFLDGFFLPDAPEFGRWAEGERDRIGREYARAVEALAESAEQRGDAVRAVDWWRRLAVHDPYNSRVALRLMRSLVAVGERAAAIQHARTHETLLVEELEVQPDAAVRAFAEQLRRDDAVEQEAAIAAPVPGVISTAAGSGSDVEAAQPASLVSEDGSQSLPARPAVQRVSRRARWSLLAAALVIATLVTAIAVAGRERRALASRPAPATRTIAVLPFANLSANAENEYFSDGITDELIATLGQLRGLRVVSRTSAFAFKNKGLDVREVGQRLGAVAIVEGSVRQSGSALRVTAQLVDAETGYDLWSGTYSRELEDVFAIQEQIARAIAARLVGTLGDSVALAERSTRDPVTYDLYLRGRHAWHERTSDGLRRAIEYFEQAVAREPDYARAHAALGDAYSVSAFYDYLPPREAYPKAEAAARRAMQLDPTLAEPHATMGYVHTYYHLDAPRAEAAFERALAAAPGYSTAHQWYANLLTVTGRFADAERRFRAAQEADPLSVIAQAALGWSFYFAGRHEDALEQCRRTLALKPDFELAHLWGGWALQELGRSAEAREWVERAVGLSHGGALARLGLGYVLGRSESGADRDSARAIIRDMEARHARGEYVPAYEVAKVHLALGDRPSALRWLERAVDDRSHSLAFLRVDPQLAPLRGDPRFQAVVERSGVFTARGSPAGAR